jgi:hypothetical protein
MTELLSEGTGDVYLLRCRDDRTAEILESPRHRSQELAAGCSDSLGKIRRQGSTPHHKIIHRETGGLQHSSGS